MTRLPAPVVAVLLASHNGSRWIEEQLQSIVDQAGRRHADHRQRRSSTDDTLQILAGWQRRQALEVLPPAIRPLGSANRNFLRLICDAPLADERYVAFADQDDVWKPEKLSRAVCGDRSQGARRLFEQRARLLARWPPTRVVESRRRHGASTTCSNLADRDARSCFAARPSTASASGAVRHAGTLQDIKVHDWLIYALARSLGWTWHIDPWPSVMYRQHAHNEIGANVGSAAAMRRLRLSRDGTYRRDVLAVARAVGDTSWVVEALSRNHWRDRLRLLLNIGELRRRARDRWALAVLLLLMGKA